MGLTKTLHPTGIYPLTPDEFDFGTTAANMLGEANGTYSSCTLYYIDGLRDWSTWNLFRFDDAFLGGAIINGFKVTAKGLKSASGSHLATMQFCPFQFDPGTVYKVKPASRPLILNKDPAVGTTQVDLSDQDIANIEASLGPNGFHLFNTAGENVSGGEDTQAPVWYSVADLEAFPNGDRGWSPNVGLPLGPRCNTFDALAGISFRWRAYPGETSPHTLMLDTFEVEINHTPQPAWVRRKDVVPSGVTALSNDDESVAGVLPEVTDEVPWADLSAVLVDDTTTASVGVGDASGTFYSSAGSTDPGAVSGTTELALFTFPPGTIAGFTRGAKELRILVECFSEGDDFYDDGMSLVGGSYVVVDDAVLRLPDGAGELAQLSDGGDLYDARDDSIGSYGWSPTPNTTAGHQRAVRWRAICLNVSGLSDEMLDAMDADGYEVLVRWALENPNNAPGTNDAVRQFIVRRVRFVWCCDASAGESADSIKPFAISSAISGSPRRRAAMALGSPISSRPF